MIDLDPSGTGGWRYGGIEMLPKFRAKFQMDTGDLRRNG